MNPEKAYFAADIEGLGEAGKCALDKSRGLSWDWRLPLLLNNGTNPFLPSNLVREMGIGLTTTGKESATGGPKWEE